MATAISFIRVTVIASVLAPSIALQVGIPLIVAAIVACAFAAVTVRRVPVEGAQAGAVFRNPFSFWSVLLMAASMGLLVVLGRVINARFGASGTILGAASMGLFDVDAMTVSMARLVPVPVTSLLGAQAVLAGVASNTLMKVAIAGAIGRGRFASDVALVALCCLIAGAVTLLGVQAMN